MRGWLIHLLGGHTTTDLSRALADAYHKGVRSMVSEMGRREDQARGVLFQAGKQYSKDRIEQMRLAGSKDVNPNVVPEGEGRTIPTDWRERLDG